MDSRFYQSSAGHHKEVLYSDASGVQVWGCSCGATAVVFLEPGARLTDTLVLTIQEIIARKRQET